MRGVARSATGVVSLSASGVGSGWAGPGAGKASAESTGGAGLALGASLGAGLGAVDCLSMLAQVLPTGAAVAGSAAGFSSTTGLEAAGAFLSPQAEDSSVGTESC